MPSERAVDEGALPRRLIDVRPGEWIALSWAWLYVLAVMAAYYVIRPVRDAMGVEGGVDNLQWLFTGTLLAMIAINPAYAALVRRWARERFITVTYVFFMANLLLFAVAMHVASAGQLVWVGRVFFIWVSVFNLFVVSVFWALMVDVFDTEQAKRLFGLISAGATIGAMAGSGIASALAHSVPTTWLLLGSVALLCLAVFCVRRLSRLAPALRAPREVAAARSEVDAPIGGSLMAGLAHTLRSPYLLGISLYILLYAITSTFLYFQQAAIVAEHFADRAARTAFFANVDLVVNVLTLVVQVFVTNRFLRRFGVTITIGLLPLVSVISFGVLAVVPTVAVLVAVQVIRRVGNFGFAKPTREVLFTVTSREDKYKAKPVIDTVVYRGGDQVGSWSYALLGWMGFGPVGVAIVAVPLSVLWLFNALWLGRRQAAMVREQRGAAQAEAAAPAWQGS
ncbi:NTP/NDP exchange transporter [Uliginosibacterium sp. sgz301328]|uniref:NTP/NDP exchange transporter n=1 Tax=Uliginosibacterium sp. sgz301328 TaxID=3243764 RepID=UPI00359E07E5